MKEKIIVKSDNALQMTSYVLTLEFQLVIHLKDVHAIAPRPFIQVISATFPSLVATKISNARMVQKY